MTIHYGLTYDQYAALEGEGIGALLKMRRSPKHYRYERDKPPTSTDALEFGKGLHTLLLEPGRWDKDVHVWTKTKGRTAKAYVDFAAANPGLTIVLESEVPIIEDMVSAIRSHDVASHYLDGNGAAEVTVQWKDDRTGRACRARADWLTDAAIVDIKTTRDAAPFPFGRQAAQLGYHVRAAWYVDGFAKVTDRLRPYVFIAADKEPPHDVVVYTCPSPVMHAGRDEYRRLLELLVECESTGRWPGMAEDEEVDLMLPAYAMGGPDEIIIEGEKVAV